MLHIETGTDNPVLRKKSVPVTEFGEHLDKLAFEMFEAMEKAEGIGLAAPQVGINQRLFVMDYKLGDKKFQQFVFVNPEILERSSATETAEEGCLSLPKQFDKVSRASWVKVRYQTTSGEVQELIANGINARCIQHEIDHLEGVLFVDRVTTNVLIGKESEQHLKM